MDDHGPMRCVAMTGPVHVFACDTCGRTLAIGGDQPITVISHGERSALHQSGVIASGSMTVGAIDADYEALFNPR